MKGFDHIGGKRIWQDAQQQETLMFITKAEVVAVVLATLRCFARNVTKRLPASERQVRHRRLFLRTQRKRPSKMQAIDANAPDRAAATENSTVGFF
jgi:hypothetical protein